MNWIEEEKTGVLKAFSQDGIEATIKTKTSLIDEEDSFKAENLVTVAHLVVEKKEDFSLKGEFYYKTRTQLNLVIRAIFDTVEEAKYYADVFAGKLRRMSVWNEEVWELAE